MQRPALPQLDGSLWLTDGGIETTLIFLEGIDLPDFAAFDLLKSAEGEAALRKYFDRYAGIAQRFGAGLVLESPTWRASADWGARLGYGAREVTELNIRAIDLMRAVQWTFPGRAVISGCIGPRGDGYDPGRRMSAKEAEAYHRLQVDAFAPGAADMASAITMNYAEEAVGIARAAQRAGLPVAISFTVETDGRLPTGQPLADAIAQVDDATGGYPAYYMLNCAHPSHFDQIIKDEGVFGRLRGLRANASRKSHAELNESPTLDAGDPAELGAQYAELKRRLPSLNVLGGCCGTDHRHIERIAAACAPLFGGGS
jgi:homocysteine S-methyltransferase